MSSLSHILAPDPDELPSARASPPPPSSVDVPATDEHRAASPMSVSNAKRFEHVDDDDDDEDDAISTPKGDGHPLHARHTPAEEANPASTTASAKRNATGATSSVYAGNKIRHLKKEDGIPLWRKDIQYDFLSLVFNDQTKCFTNYPDGTTDHTFAEIYVDAMARSNKCSKVLKEKLLQGQEGAISMAMVCLLVNVGRMNTTLNFFPEMRAQLRTYHSIPALQAHRDPNAYKQLQDAPRLKSILKGATEDNPQPSTLEELRAKSVPRTNPVNLIFIMSQLAPKITEQHFPPGGDFFDLIMRGTLSSASRAAAFLWLMWFYLESDFSETDALKNPFGPGQVPKGNPEASPFEVPTLESLTEEQTALENVDTEKEKEFGEKMRKERISILASEPSPAMTALKRAKKEKLLSSKYHASDDEGSDAGWYRGSEQKINSTKLETGSEYTRSPSPATGRAFQAINSKPVADVRINDLLNSDDPMDGSSPRAISATSGTVKKGPGRGNWRRNRGTNAASSSAMRTSMDGSHHVPLLPNTGQLNFVNEGPQPLGTPTASGSYQFSTLASKSAGSPNAGSLVSFQNPKDHVPTPSFQTQKRHRGVTQHQSAVITHRKLQIDYTLDRRIRKLHIRSGQKREAESAIVRAWKRVHLMPSDYDSEEESIRIRKAKERSEKTEEDGWRATHRGGKENDDFDNIEFWRRPRLGLSGFIRANGETNDIGEEAKALAQTFRRCARRIDRWQESSMPGETMTLRQSRPAAKPTTRRSFSRESSVDGDHSEIVAKPRTARRSNQHLRNGAGRSVSRRPRVDRSKSAQEIKAEHDADEDDGGGIDLDEEDRELLGEVDADESEEEDGDEEMDDS